MLNLKPIQYYATNDALPRGKYFMFKGDWYWSATIILHPADFEEQEKELSRHCRLIHIREWMPSHGQQARVWEEVLEGVKGL